jgi:anthranilate phosphoribosyltransferase
MKKILQRLSKHEQLTREEAAEVLTNITQGSYNDAQISAFITVYLMRGISPEELSGFRSALLALCKRIDVGGIDCIDVCGTGGDGKDTFNISTLSAFVVAGAGYKVIKHGNASVSSNCGSSDVLMDLGYTFTTDESKLLSQLEKSNFCYFHAPLFHPALKSVGQIRRDLGIKTFFNMLGPLVNPAQPTHQLVGVFSSRLMRLYQCILEEEQINYTILHGLDGYDEVSLTDDTKIITSQSGSSLMSHKDLGLPKYQQWDIYGGATIGEAKQIFINVLNNKATQAQTDVVLANSALAIDTMKSESHLSDSMDEAQESLFSGRAYEVLRLVTSN